MVELGAEFVGRYTIDADDVSGSTRYPVEAFPLRNDSVIVYDLVPNGSFNVVIGSDFIDGAVEGVHVFDDLYDGRGDADGWSTGSAHPGFGLAVRFLDSTGTRLFSEAFFVNAELAGWDYAKFSITNFDDRGSVKSLAFGHIESLYVVPEPSTATLVALGLLAVVAQRRVS